MRRREFIAGIGGAVAWPLAAQAQAQAQETAAPVIGFISPGTSERSMLNMVTAPFLNCRL
jgi:hypothetical protein